MHSERRAPPLPDWSGSPWPHDDAGLSLSVLTAVTGSVGTRGGHGTSARPDHAARESPAHHRPCVRPDSLLRGPRDDADGRAARDSTVSSGRRGPSGGCDAPRRSGRGSPGSGNGRSRWRKRASSPAGSCVSCADVDDAPAGIVLHHHSAHVAAEALGRFCGTQHVAIATPRPTETQYAASVREAEVVRVSGVIRTRRGT